jgi:GNAT superfamily N-acetyltransferase
MSNKASPPDYEFYQLTEYSPDVLQQIQAIYDVSFPPYERKPFWMISESMNGGRYSVFVIRQQNGPIVAFALLVPLRISNAMYIEYYAVAELLRGQGIGSMLMREIIAFLTPTASAIVWEVDPPVTENDDNSRRIRFYERLGASLIEQSTQYGMPNYWKGSGIIPLRLMWQPLQNQQAQPTRSELTTFITDIYETEYRGQDVTRDEILANLDKT